MTFLATPARADTPAFVLGSVLNNAPSTFIGTKGWQFGGGGIDSDILITQLGVFDSGGDGLVNSHQVGLWRDGNVSGSLLASATVPAGTEAPLIGGYRWVEISPVRVHPYSLPTFVVAAQYSAGDADDLVTPKPQVSQSFFDVHPETFAGRASIGSDLPFPGFPRSPCEGCAGELFWEPNFQFEIVPEPSVWLLFLPALGYLFIRHRKARRLR